MLFVTSLVLCCVRLCVVRLSVCNTGECLTVSQYEQSHHHVNCSQLKFPFRATTISHEVMLATYELTRCERVDVDPPSDAMP